MIGIDTNVLLRFLTQDDAAQSERATRFLETHCSSASPGFVNVVGLAELVWTLGCGLKS